MANAISGNLAALDENGNLKVTPKPQSKQEEHDDDDAFFIE